MIYPMLAKYVLVVSTALLCLLGAAVLADVRAGWITAKLIGIHPDSVQLREQGGAVVSASLTPSSILLRNGVPTLSLKAFPLGATVAVRLRPATREGARPRVEILADSQSDAALSAYGKQTLSGMVSAAMPGWLVIKTDNFSVVPVELTSSTLYRRLGNVATDCPFGVGDRVTVAVRTSTMGTLFASSVSDQATAEGPESALPFTPSSTVKGSIYAVRPANHAIVVLTGQQAQVAISAPSNITSVRVSRRSATLADLHPGMKVVVHLAGGSDSAGYVAKSISASP